jgi:hypothetical protein
MLSDIIGLSLIVAPLVGALAWRNAIDRRAHRASVIRADVHAGATRTLGGDSYLTIDVRCPTPWRQGEVRLSAPRGYESLIGDVAGTVFERLPARYDVVIHCGGVA